MADIRDYQHELDDRDRVEVLVKSYLMRNRRGRDSQRTQCSNFWNMYNLMDISPNGSDIVELTTDELKAALQWPAQLSTARESYVQETPGAEAWTAYRGDYLNRWPDPNVAANLQGFVIPAEFGADYVDRVMEIAKEVRRGDIEGANATGTPPASLAQILEAAQRIHLLQHDVPEARADTISSAYQIQLDVQNEQDHEPPADFNASPISGFYGPNMVDLFRITGQMPETMQMAINYANDPTIRHGNPMSRLTRITNRIKADCAARKAMGAPIEESPEKLREITSFLSDLYLKVRADDIGDDAAKHAFGVQGLIENMGSEQNAMLYAPEKLEARALASAGITNPYAAWMYHQIAKLGV